MDSVTYCHIHASETIVMREAQNVIGTSYDIAFWDLIEGGFDLLKMCMAHHSKALYCFAGYCIKDAISRATPSGWPPAAHAFPEQPSP